MFFGHPLCVATLHVYGVPSFSKDSEGPGRCLSSTRRRCAAADAPAEVARWAATGPSLPEGPLAAAAAPPPGAAGAEA